MKEISKTQVENFFSNKKMVMIGMSRNPKDYTRNLSRDLTVRGYEIYPVNPNASEIEGKKCYSNVASVDAVVNAALIFTKGETLSANLDEAVNKGIKHIWLNFDKPLTPVLKGKVEKYGEQGINIIHGFCPYMFIENPQFFHKLHRFFVKRFGAFPK
ncbi:MAG: CoA-binding protein [Ignavibacteriales bacterium]|nr:MAG: CoA-binding protein [Ignavibacteriales bacterium]